ncbi:MAG: hypothetical protein GC204_06660 [Chloroflexi bacterium]|nr:hypothetical protein [Chloroflexota bacterium]
MSEDLSQVAASFDALRSRFDTLYTQASLPDLSSAMDTLSRDVARLPGEIAKVRSRGYAFASYLEHKAEVLEQNWNTLRADAQRAISDESQRLTSETHRLRYRIDTGEGLRGNLTALQAQLPDLERSVQMIETMRTTAESRIKAIFATLQTDTAQTLSQLQTINWYIDQKDEASFPFLAGEALFLAAKAEWVATGKGKDDPDGILYLTDQRLVFEQKETTGKKLGMFGGKKTQELEWEIPLHQITGVKPENKGFLGGKDMLNFTLGSGARYSAITVEVKGGVASKFWAAQIQRMIDGKTTDERAIQPDAETLEAIKNAPTACLSCGGTLPMLVAGQRQVECPYCGSVIRI